MTSDTVQGEFEPTATKARARRLAALLDVPVMIVGLILFAIWMMEPLTEWPRSGRTELLMLLVPAGLFAVEFVARALAASATWSFLRQNWWEVPLIALAFLRFLRLGRLTRLGRAGRGLTAAVRSGRSASRTLAGRLSWLLVLTVTVALVSGRILKDDASYEGGWSGYGKALHDAAMTTLTGATFPVTTKDGWTRLLELIVAAFSVVVFAALAGILGAYFLELRTRADPERSHADGSPLN